MIHFSYLLEIKSELQIMFLVIFEFYKNYVYFKNKLFQFEIYLEFFRNRVFFNFTNYINVEKYSGIEN